MKILATALVLSSLLFSGCQSTGGIDPATKELLVNATIVYTTAKVLENNPTYAPRVAEIAASIGALAKGDTASTVAALITIARDKINWEELNKSPADASLVNLLLQTLQTELTARLGANPLPPDKLLKVAEVAALIEATARGFIPPLP